MREQRDLRAKLAWGLLLLSALLCGCGTTRVTDTTRTATEQLLISRSIDDTVSNLDFRMLSGKRVFLDSQYLDGVTDKGYLISSLRQHMLACGCLLQEERKNSVYIVEARAGSIGTDRNDWLIGVPQMSVPSVMPGVPGGMIPEIPLAKKTNRRAVAKIAVFAYNRKSGEPIWQSGTKEAVCKQRDSWLFGAGPFRRGTLIKGTQFDETNVVVPVLDKNNQEPKFDVVSATTPQRWKLRLPPDGPLDDDKVKTVKADKESKSDSKESKSDSKVIQASAEKKAE